MDVVPTAVPPASVAVFLGAGASRAYGFPVTAELLPLIRIQANTGELFRGFDDAPRRRRDLQRFFDHLFPGLSKRGLRAPLVTDVLSLIDYSIMSETSLLYQRKSADLMYFRELLEQAVYDVLWPEYKEPPAALRKLVDWLQFLMAMGRTGVITSNYDMSVEDELVSRLSKVHEGALESKFDFGFTWRDPQTGSLHERPADPLLSVYKLHGSVNWLRCGYCEHTYINLWGPIGGWSFDEPHEHNTCHCDHRPLRHVLIAPSLVRDIRDVNLLEIWKHALELLRTADRWVVIGYSFPPEDLSIRSMFMRALRGRTTQPEITVVQCGMDREVWSRYKLLFPDCRYRIGGLEKFLQRERRQIARQFWARR